MVQLFINFWDTILICHGKKYTVVGRYSANRNLRLYLIEMNKRVTLQFQTRAALTSVKSV